MLKAVRSLVLGDLPAFTADPLAYLEARTVGRPDPVELRFGSKPVVVLSQPSAIEHVLVTKADMYGKGSFQDRLRPLFGDGMLTASGARWEASRKAVRGAFSGAGLDDGMQMALSVLMQEVTRLAMRTGEVVSLPALAGRLTLRMASAAMFRQAFDEKAADEIYEHAAAAHHWVSETMWKPVHFGTSLPTPANRRFRDLVVALEGIVEDLRREPKGVLASLTHLTDEFGAKAIRDEFITMILAGFETSGTTAAWLMYLLASRPDVVAWLREEIDPLLADGRDMTPQSLRLMARTRSVVDEVMRLYPAIWWFTRTAAADDVIDGHRVRRGTSVFISPWTLHRQPNLWSAAETFEPTRFLNRPANKFAYIPFGAGARVCIGQHLARAEFIALAATLVAAFDLEPMSGPIENLRPVGGVTLAPPQDGLSVRVHLRSRTPVRRVA